MLGLILLILLILLIVGALPHWPYAQPYGYGYWPSGMVFLILIVVIILIGAGTIPFAWR